MLDKYLKRHVDRQTYSKQTAGRHPILPKNIAATRAVVPPTMCTTELPAKSIAPTLNRRSSGSALNADAQP